jgi:nicotinamide-nucleotide amidase
MRAEIVCIGSELLLGDIADTNTQYLARRLSGIGVDLYYSTCVGDNLARIVDCLRRGLSRSDVVFTSGGLGPTDDDLTREAIAEVMGETPFVDETLAEDLRRFFELRRMPMTTNNLKQASRIPSVRIIPNSRGTAPGWWASTQGKSIVAMPGPPGELHNMWETQVEPQLHADSTVICSRTLKAFSISESRVDELLEALTPAANPTVAIYAKQDGIHVRITAKAKDTTEALAAIHPLEDRVRQLLGPAVWGADDDTQESITAAMVEACGVSLALAETVTCGQVSAFMAPVAAGKPWFRGGLVLPATGSDNSLELAERARTQFDADVVLAVCGGPVEQSDPPMDELRVAVLHPVSGVAAESVYRSRHQLVRTLGAYYALHELRRVLAALP